MEHLLFRCPLYTLLSKSPSCLLPSFTLQVAITIYWLGRTTHSLKDYHGPQLNLSAFDSIVSPARVRSETQKYVYMHGYMRCGCCRRRIRYYEVGLPDGDLVIFSVVVPVYTTRSTRHLCRPHCSNLHWVSRGGDCISEFLGRKTLCYALLQRHDW